MAVMNQNQPLEIPKGRSPVVMIGVIVLVVAVLGGAALLFFGSGDANNDATEATTGNATGIEPADTPDNAAASAPNEQVERISLVDYADKFCGVVQDSQGNFTELAEVGAALDEAFSTATTLFDPELIAATQAYYQLSVNSMRGMITGLAAVNEDFVIDHPEGEFMRRDTRSTTASLIEDLDEVEALIVELSTHQSEEAYEQAAGVIVDKMNNLDLEITGPDWKPLDEAFQAELDSRGGDCAFDD